MLISLDSQEEGSGQQLSPDKASLFLRVVRAQPNNLAMYRKLHGHMGGEVFSGKHLVAKLRLRLLFSFCPCPYPCTSSGADHVDLVLGVVGCLPFTIQVWKRGHSNKGVARSGGALESELPSGIRNT